MWPCTLAHTVPGVNETSSTLNLPGAAHTLKAEVPLNLGVMPGLAALLLTFRLPVDLSNQAHLWQFYKFSP